MQNELISRIVKIFPMTEKKNLFYSMLKTQNLHIIWNVLKIQQFMLHISDPMMPNLSKNILDLNPYAEF
ncbi:hypothetical protein OOZ15_14365 [Galbibacter sp. EGI 63066]|uniref:hypothetical protein n=1 Tax=Galbibacter sp. EGI 63066 TaxID=2993559 RepID=UPI002248DB6A|nr:hypothetical protein [Galbibacter sp. EGI 63066]MCX2681132.1 hypothetical protein [Galbibacter sp. EGI 63066]